MDYMFPPFSLLFSDDAGGMIHCPIIVKNENVASLPFFIIDQWQDVDVPEFSKSWVLKNLLYIPIPFYVPIFLLQAREHTGILVS